MRYAFVALVVSVGLAVGFSFVYTNKVHGESNHNWCALLTELDNAYVANPPTTPTGKNVASAVHKLRADLGC